MEWYLSANFHLFLSKLWQIYDFNLFASADVSLGNILVTLMRRNKIGSETKESSTRGKKWNANRFVLSCFSIVTLSYCQPSSVYILNGERHFHTV